MKGRLGGLVLALAVLLFGLLLRVVQADPAVFQQGALRVPPFDDLYHAKRIVHSALRFPSVLELDPARGPAGAWCPWPPLYDLAAGGLARLSGCDRPSSILGFVIWIPPVVTALWTAVLCGILAGRLGLSGGSVAAVVVSLSFPLVSVSWIGSIDHHFLEPPLLLGIAWAVVSLGGDRPARWLASGVLFGLALSVAHLVQTAFLLAAAVAFVVIFLSRSPSRLRAGAVGFAVAAIVVLAYRITRPAGYPGGQWFLGYPHVAAFLAAATACLAREVRLRRGSTARVDVVALLLGAGVALSVPGSAAAFADGALFFGGDPWLSTISEFRPLFVGRSTNVFQDLLSLGGAALLVLPLATSAARSSSWPRTVAAFFAVAYLLAALSSRRFLVPAAPFLALAAAAYVSDRLSSGRRAAGWLGVALVGVPALVSSLGWLTRPTPIVHWTAEPFLRAAEQLRDLPPASGRVLCPWSFGHLVGILSRHPVLVDNFGSMQGRNTFEGSLETLLVTGEEAAANACRMRGIRFLVLDTPYLGIRSVAAILGRPLEPFLGPDARRSTETSPTGLLRSTIWWRCYYDGGASRPDLGERGGALRLFRKVWEDESRSRAPDPYGGPAVQIWEVVPAEPPTGLSRN